MELKRSKSLKNYSLSSTESDLLYFIIVFTDKIRFVFVFRGRCLRVFIYRLKKLVNFSKSTRAFPKLDKKIFSIRKYQ
jgi:hypothetical protein